jgi:hypothetical protein
MGHSNEIDRTMMIVAAKSGSVILSKFCSAGCAPVEVMDFTRGHSLKGLRLHLYGVRHCSDNEAENNDNCKAKMSLGVCGGKRKGKLMKGTFWAEISFKPQGTNV